MKNMYITGYHKALICRAYNSYLHLRSIRENHKSLKFIGLELGLKELLQKKRLNTKVFKTKAEKLLDNIDETKVQSIIINAGLELSVQEGVNKNGEL